MLHRPLLFAALVVTCAAGLVAAACSPDLPTVSPAPTPPTAVSSTTVPPTAVQPVPPPPSTTTTTVPDPLEVAEVSVGDPVAFSGVVRTRRNLPFGEHPRQAVDIFVPLADGPVPVVVFAHGGGWSQGDRTYIDPNVADLLGHGVAVVSTGYRMAPEYHWPEPQRDVAAAVAFTVANAEAWGVDPTRVTLAGFSVGATMALTVAFNPGAFSDVPLPIIGVLAAAGPTDLVAWSAQNPAVMLGVSETHLGCDMDGSGDIVTDQWWLPAAPCGTEPVDASPARTVVPQAPPVWVTHAADDNVVAVSHARDLTESARAAGIAVRYIEVPAGGHITNTAVDLTYRLDLVRGQGF